MAMGGVIRVAENVWSVGETMVKPGNWRGQRKNWEMLSTITSVISGRTKILWYWYAPHFWNIFSVQYHHLRNISKIRKNFSKESIEILIHAFVSSKLDHCNSLLYGLPAYQLAKLQVLQNTAARVVSLTRKYDHITPVLESPLVTG